MSKLFLKLDLSQDEKTTVRTWPSSLKISVKVIHLCSLKSYDRIIRIVRPFSLFPCIVGFIEFECGHWTQVEYLFRIVSPASLN